MMRGSDSTTAMSSRRPPMTAGPIERNRRFLSAVSYGDCANAPAANPESAIAAVKMQIGDSFLEGMTVSLNRSYCTSSGGLSSGSEFALDLVMRNHLAGANFVARPRDCRDVLVGHRFVIQWC